MSDLQICLDDDSLNVYFKYN